MPTVSDVQPDAAGSCHNSDWLLLTSLKVPLTDCTVAVPPIYGSLLGSESTPMAVAFLSQDRAACCI